MTILLLKGYNNYFNRIHKQEADITAYKSASTSYLEYPNVNFDPQDGIATTLIVGSEVQRDPKLVWPATLVNEVLKFDELGCPDYLIVYENLPLANGGPKIKSRWFIIESVKIRQGQYKLALKRDLLTDFNEQIMNNPCFVEKGYINDVTNPLLLNSEGMKFNQIKQSEQFIKDDSHCAWLVGYVKKNIDNNDLTNVNPIVYTVPRADNSTPAATVYDWEECIHYYDINGQQVNNSPKDCFYFYNSDVSFRTWYQPNYFSIMTGNVRTKFTENYQMLYNSTDYPNEDWGKLNSTAFDIPSSHSVGDSEAARIAGQIFTLTRDDEDIRNKFKTMLATAKYNQFTASTVVVDEDIFKYNGTTVSKDGHIYRLEINPGQQQTSTQYFTGNDTAAVSWMTSVASKIQYLDFNTDNPSRKKVQIDFRGKAYQIIAREIFTSQTLSFNFPAAGLRNNCRDATYDMFAMPIDPKALGLTTASADEVVVAYDDEDDPYDSGVVDLSAISENQLAMAMAITTKLGANSDASLVYDLQLLPYCPFENLNVYFENTIYGPTYGKWVINTGYYGDVDYSLIRNVNNDVRGIIFYPQRANFSTLVDFVEPNESVHEEWLTIENPILTAQGRQGDLTRWAFFSFPYKVTDGTWDIGPNSNNSDVDVELSDGLTNDDCEYISLYVSSGLQAPFLSITSEDLPLQPANDYSTTIVGDFKISVKAHWIMPDRPEDIKIKNECDMYRLSSPNFMSLYEFKKTMLRDGLKSFNIDCTYKPFNPYIKVNPNYDDSLYAVQDFNDNMGLVITGDFSLPMLSDAWVNYELANRNYQAIFNRQIQNLDVNQQIAKEQQQFQAVVGTITGGVGGAGAGAYAGMKMGGPWGAVAGAVIGGVAGTALSGVGGVKDTEWLARQQEENRSFAIDQYNYQLGNTQALNATATKSTPLTYNNKVWPILEYYSCTEQEKNVLRNKIKYDGMTIMAIDKLKNYNNPGTRLKGQMIRLENLDDDSHIAQAIYEEVEKGFYEGE